MRGAYLLAAGLLALAIGNGPAAAQINAPPMDPGQVLRSQPMPQTTVPPADPPPSPSTGASGAHSPVAPARRGSRYRDRVRDCQHQAAVERVPRSERGSYMNWCLQGD